MKPWLTLLAESGSEEQLLEHLSAGIAAEVPDGEAELLLVDAAGFLVLRASSFAPAKIGRVRFDQAIGLTGKTLQVGHPVHVESQLLAHPAAQRYPDFDESTFESAKFVPVATPGLRGVWILRSRKVWPQDVAHEARLMELCLGALEALAAYQHILAVGALSDRLRPLSEVAATLAGSPYLEEILQLLVNLTAEQFGYKVCTVRLLDETTDELVLRATQAKMSEYQRKRALRVGESIAGVAVLEMRTIIVTDVLNEATYVGHDLAEQQGLRSMICVPLIVSGRAIGVLTCYADEIRNFDEDEKLALETIAKQAATSIENAKLNVRSTLMQEMHHRVKNNLQQVVSLLRLQLRHKHYATLEDAIGDSINRILAIAAVHDLLSREDLDRVGMRVIADSLVHHIQQSTLLPDRRVRFDVRGSDVKLNMVQATQVALVLNELILNALEHGFKKALQGEVHVTFEEQDRTVSLWVANNGDPLPTDFDVMVNAHLGLQIVSNLSRGLGGTFRLHDSHGWAVAEVIFPRSDTE